MLRVLRHCSTSSPSHEGFSLYVHTGPSTKEPPLTNYNSTLGVHYFSLKYNHFYTRGIGTKPNHNHPTQEEKATKPKLNHLYTRGIRHKANTQPQSPLHKRDHLYTRGIDTNPKQRRDYKLGDHNRPQTTLCDHNRPQTIFLTKQDPIDRIDMIDQV